MFRKLERPKGCLKALRLLHEQSEITIRDLMRKTSLSQNGAYSSLSHLKRLRLVESLVEVAPRGLPRRYALTEKGEEILLPLSLFFDSLPLVLRMQNIDSYLETPYCTWEVLLRAFRRGRTTLAELVEDGMCKDTASSGLRALLGFGLLEMKIRSGFRWTRKEYTPTEKGHFLGRVIHLVDEKMTSLTSE